MIRPLGGNQFLHTTDGFVVPFTVVNGLVYMLISSPTDGEIDSLPHVILASDAPLDPAKYPRRRGYPPRWIV